MNLLKNNVRPNQDYESNPAYVDYNNNPHGLLAKVQDSTNSRPAGGLDRH